MKRAACGAAALASLLLATVQPALPDAPPAVPPWTLELERRLQPWCLGDCALAVPFTARYEAGDRRLVFVGVRHAFTPGDPTMRAVDAGLEAIPDAGILIVEGFPTAMGENPAPLVIQAQRIGDPDADSFTRGEAMHAISGALAREIPFVGGEPTRSQQVESLARRGYTPADIAFSYVAGGLSQAIRSGELVDTADPRLRDAYASWSEAFTQQYALEPLTYDDFASRYREMFGIEVTGDAAFTSRMEPGEDSALARLNQADMVARDEHLLATIEDQLAKRKRVLVVYGGSHWTTLSQVLEERLGKPVIAPFVAPEPR